MYPQAFGLKNESDEWTKIKKTLYKSGGFGHPTLSPVFDKKVMSLRVLTPNVAISVVK
ncbi:hypothetical protein [Legionella feeleii]|uniref:hypothetical protein n=1 Tax=Legionella feeleii TaxID=453 RepID=UPI001559A88A|nr:hypothetical protein [Legionella feeleii]